MKSRLLKLFGVLALVAIATGATIALAGSLSDSTTINACIEKNGKVNIYPPPKACPADQTPLSWNVQGPAGATGPQGQQGQKGEQGPAGSAPASPDAIAGTLSAHGVQQGRLRDRPPTSSGSRTRSSRLVTQRVAGDRKAPAQAVHDHEGDRQVVAALPQVDLHQRNADLGADRPAPAERETMATVELENAHVSGREQHGSTETISFVYQKITWTWTDGNITAQDDWEIQNS